MKAAKERGRPFRQHARTESGDIGIPLSAAQFCQRSCGSEAVDIRVAVAADLWNSLLFSLYFPFKVDGAIRTVSTSFLQYPSFGEFASDSPIS